METWNPEGKLEARRRAKEEMKRLLEERHARNSSVRDKRIGDLGVLFEDLQRESKDLKRRLSEIDDEEEEIQTELTKLLAEIGEALCRSCAKRLPLTCVVCAERNGLEIGFNCKECCGDVGVADGCPYDTKREIIGGD